MITYCREVNLTDMIYSCMVDPESSATQGWLTGTTSTAVLSWQALYHFLVCLFII